MPQRVLTISDVISVTEQIGNISKENVTNAPLMEQNPAAILVPRLHVNGNKMHGRKMYIMQNVSTLPNYLSTEQGSQIGFFKPNSPILTL